MKLFLYLNGLVCLALGVMFSVEFYCSHIVKINDFIISDGVFCVLSVVFYMLCLMSFFFAICLKKMDDKNKKREDELTNLVQFMKDGREQQSLLINALKEQVDKKEQILD